MGIMGSSRLPYNNNLLNNRTTNHSINPVNRHTNYTVTTQQTIYTNTVQTNHTITKETVTRLPPYNTGKYGSLPTPATLHNRVVP